MCVACAVGLIASLIPALPTLAAEELTVQAATPDATPFAPEPLGVALSVSSEEVTEPLDLSESAAQDAGEAFAFPDDNEIYDLILRVRRKNDILTSTLVGLQRGLTNYIPLLEMSRLVKFPSEGDLKAQRVTGTFFNPQNTYSVDVRNNSYTVRGERFDLPPGSAIVRDLGHGLGDIYVTPDLLNALWSIDAEIDFAEQAVNIKTPKKLPYEQERERRRRQGDLSEEEEEARLQALEFVPNTYRLFSPHMFNLSAQSTWSEEDGLSNNITLSGVGNLYGTSADYTGNLYHKTGEKPEVQNLRLRLTRQNFGEGSLPFGLRLAQLGDISAKPPPLIDKTLFGRGLYLSSASTAAGRQTFDEVTIQGTGQPGWEVEIYRGRELLDFGFIDARGEYRFEDVPLRYGRNTLRLVFYGPQGEVVEETREYKIQNDRLRPGKTTFESALLDFRQPLFDVDDRGPENGNDEGAAGYLRVNRGLNHWMTGFATLTKTPVGENDRSYATVGADFNALGGLGQVEAYKQLNGGSLLDTRFTHSFAGINTSLRGSVFHDFESREAGFGDNAKTLEGELRAAKSFNLSFAQASVHVKALHTERENGQKTTRATLGKALGIGKVNFNNSLLFNYRNGDHTATDGQFSVSTPLSSRLLARATLDYDVHPSGKLDSSRLNLRYTNHDRFTATLNARQGIEDTDKASIKLGAAYDFGTFLGGVDAGWDKQDGLDMLLRASTTLGPDGEGNDYIFTTDYTGYTTALKIRLFEDMNMDGTFNAADTPVKGGRVLVNGRTTDKSDADGYIEILGAGPPGMVEVTVDQESLPNPFLAPLKDGYRTVLRPRTKPFIDFALIQTGSIDGIIRFADGRPVPGVIIQLLDENGRLVAEATTLSDGYYVFEYVRPGTYMVRAHPSHQVFVPPATVRVTSEDLFAYGVDLQILGQTEEVSASENSDDGDRGRVAHTNHAPDAAVTKQSAPYSSEDGVQAVVRAVRIGEHPYKVRLVMDLSGPVGYSMSSEDGGHIINIDLPSTAWDADRVHDMSKHPLFKACEVLRSPDGTGTRLRLTGRKPIEVFYNATLPPENGHGHRIYIDFIAP